MPITETAYLFSGSLFSLFTCSLRSSDVDFERTWGALAGGGGLGISFYYFSVPKSSGVLSHPKCLAPFRRKFVFQDLPGTVPGPSLQSLEAFPEGSRRIWEAGEPAAVPPLTLEVVSEIDSRSQALKQSCVEAATLGRLVEM